MHIRQQIREEAKDAIAGIGLESVHTNRIQDLLAVDLPAGVIVTEDETSQRTSKDGGLTRAPVMLIVILVEGDSETLDDDLDDWAEKIEAQMKALPSASLVTLSATSLDLQPDESGERWFGSVALEYSVLAFTT